MAVLKWCRSRKNEILRRSLVLRLLHHPVLVRAHAKRRTAIATRRGRESKRQRIGPRNDMTDRACSLHLHLCIESRTSSQNQFLLRPSQTYQRRNLTRRDIQIRLPLFNSTRSRHAIHPSLSMCTLPRLDTNTLRRCHRRPLFASVRPLDIDRRRETRRISVALPACITHSAQLRQLSASTRPRDITHRRTAEHMLRLVKVPWLLTHHTARMRPASAIRLLSRATNQYVSRNTESLAQL